VKTYTASPIVHSTGVPVWVSAIMGNATTIEAPNAEQ
jgi:hypothetical protein